MTFSSHPILAILLADPLWITTPRKAAIRGIYGYLIALFHLDNGTLLVRKPFAYNLAVRVQDILAEIQVGKHIVVVLNHIAPLADIFCIYGDRLTIVVGPCLVRHFICSCLSPLILGKGVLRTLGISSGRNRFQFYRVSNLQFYTNCHVDLGFSDILRR